MLGDGTRNFEPRSSDEGGTLNIRRASSPLVRVLSYGCTGLTRLFYIGNKRVFTINRTRSATLCSGLQRDVCPDHQVSSVIIANGEYGELVFST
ncbi:hypothetical protein TNCV_858521 [Trichonephila clavipes]|nr:hypothetical protein TNCV_858521 [Trichonephila clavipes]